jgi:hypothetical protein
MTQKTAAGPRHRTDGDGPRDVEQLGGRLDHNNIETLTERQARKLITSFGLSVPVAATVARLAFTTTGVRA